MANITDTFHVEAPPAKVWAVTIDVERWTEFVPHFQRIVRGEQGPFAIGSSARITPKGFFGAVWAVVEYAEGRSFTWDANMLPGVRVSARHTVEPDGEGARVTLFLEVSGPMWFLLAPALTPTFRRNIHREGEGLKLYCEAKA